MLAAIAMYASLAVADDAPISLDEALRRAAESWSVQSADAGVTSVDARVVQARSGLLPQVQLQGNV